MFDFPMGTLSDLREALRRVVETEEKIVRELAEGLGSLYR